MASYFVVCALGEVDCHSLKREGIVRNRFAEDGPAALCPCWGSVLLSSQESSSGQPEETQASDVRLGIVSL